MNMNMTTMSPHANHTMMPHMNHTMMMNSTGHPHHHTTMPGMTHAGHHTGSHGNNHTMGNEHIGHGTTEHTMQMFFSTGYDIAYLFFEEWNSVNGKDLAIMIVVLFLFSVLYEGLKVGRQILLTNAVSKDPYIASPVKSLKGVSTITPSIGICSGQHFLQTLLHMVQVFLGYMLMLAFMTYNVWLCLAVICGSGLGYFLFGWKTATIVNSSGDHCN